MPHGLYFFSNTRVCARATATEAMIFQPLLMPQWSGQRTSTTCTGVGRRLLSCQEVQSSQMDGPHSSPIHVYAQDIGKTIVFVVSTDSKDIFHFPYCDHYVSHGFIMFHICMFPNVPCVCTCFHNMFPLFR